MLYKSLALSFSALASVIAAPLELNERGRARGKYCIIFHQSLCADNNL
jgi:hypothetical protein